MKLDISRQVAIDATFPIGPVRVFTGYALPLEIVGVPSVRHALKVTGVTIGVTNADGVRVTAQAVRSGASWNALFAASNFARYGTVANGVTVDLTIKRPDGTTATERVGVGRFDVVAASASSQPGTPGTFYVVKGDRCFVRSRVVGGVQHYVEQTMEYDAQIGWGANWSGDYILSSSGEFIEFTEA